MFLPVSCKKTKRYDLGALVSKNIDDAFGGSSAADLYPATKALGELRNAACMAVLVDFTRFNTPSIESLRASLKYINALTAIVSHAPLLVDVNQKRNPDTPKFFWTDAFSTESAETFNIKLEIVSCAFNCGAVMGGLAESQARSVALGEGEADSACRMYLRAAGFFHHIVDMPYVVGGGTVDLHGPAQVACKFAMLSNAQQCCYMQAASKSVHEVSLVSRAKIAAGARDLYKVTVTHLEARELRDTSINAQMLAPAQALAEYFAAEAEKVDGDALAEQGDYGTQVARLRSSAEAISRAHSIMSRAGVKHPAYEDFGPAIEAKARAVRQAYEEVKDRNNRIFHDVVPDNLPPVDGHKMVEPAAIASMFSSELKEPTVIQLVQLYQ